MPRSSGPSGWRSSGRGERELNPSVMLVPLSARDLVDAIQGPNPHVLQAFNELREALAEDEARVKERLEAIQQEKKELREAEIKRLEEFLAEEEENEEEERRGAALEEQEKGAIEEGGESGQEERRYEQFFSQKKYQVRIFSTLPYSLLFPQRNEKRSVQNLLFM